MPAFSEFVVGCPFTTSVDNGLDLDVPALITRPEGLNDWSKAERRRWLREHSYDLSTDIDEGGAVWLHAVCANLTVVANTHWEDTSLAWVAQLLPPGEAACGIVFWELPRQPFPITFAFHTADGTAGLFRVTAFSVERQTVTVQVRAHTV